MFRAYTIVHATDIAFDVCDNGMNPRQHHYCIFSDANDQWLMGSVPRVRNGIGTLAIATAHYIFIKAISESLALHMLKGSSRLLKKRVKLNNP